MAEKHLTVHARPLAPYFFGGEKNFQYGTSGQQALANPYFIESELTPSQSTMFGLVRYLGITEKKDDYSIDEDVIGAETFSMEKENQTFGKIKGISGLFIEQKCGDSVEYLIPVPFDHVNDGGTQYRPMTYKGTIATTEGTMLVPAEYSAKEGISSAYMSVTSGKLVKKDDIFKSDIQTRISKSKKEDAFFKKKYMLLNKGYSFAFCICVEEDFPEITDTIVYMGREKSPFALKVTEGRLPMEYDSKLFDAAGDSYVKRVAMADCYLPEAELNDLCYLTYVEYKNHREFYTNYERNKNVSHLRRFNKREYLYRLVKQGSVFLVKKEEIDKFDAIVNNAHRKVSGYNWMNGGK